MALEYLSNKLQQIQATDVVSEINARIRRGKTQSISPADLKEKKINQKDVGTTQTLPLTPKEAFQTAIKYLTNIIVEVPLYQQQIRKNLGNNVVWTPDQNDLIDFVFTASKFSIDDITFNDEELQLATKELQTIKEYISE